MISSVILLMLSITEFTFAIYVKQENEWHILVLDELRVVVTSTID